MSGTFSPIDESTPVFFFYEGHRLVLSTNTKKIRKKARTARPLVLNSPVTSFRLDILRAEKTEPTEVYGLYF